MTRVLFAIVRPGDKPEPHQLHPNPLVAWQRCLGVRTTGYGLLSQARRHQDRHGVRCCAFHLIDAGICPDTGL